MDDTLRRVLSHYRHLGTITRIESLGSAGGFSGARLWRVSTANGPLCLRRWPPQHPTVDRLAFIHRVLCHVSGDLDCIPRPLCTADGSTWVRCEGCLWELTKWLPGRADYWQHPSRRRLTAALTCLARFHQRAATIERPREAPSPGIARRREWLRWYAGDGSRQIAGALETSPSAEFRRLAERVLRAFPTLAPSLSDRIDEYATCPLALQPVIRDIWHDHVLFEGERVVGIVDFGAMAVDNVACDLGRLLGSLAADDDTAYAVGLNAYEHVKSLTPTERELVGLFDRCNVLLGAMNWLKWILLDERQFDDLGAVTARLERLARRLDRLTEPRGK